MFEVFGLGAEFTFDANGTERISNVVSQLQLLSSQMNTSSQDVNAYSETLGEFSNILTDMGKQMMVAGIGTTTAALYGVGKAAEWQTQMIDASRYMTDDSAEAQTRYNQTLKETAQLLGTNKKEINAAAISYMQMGKSEEDALRLAKNAGYAGVAWDIAADEVSESFKSIKAAFNINLEDQDMYQKYLDSINEVGNSTAATSKDVVRFLAAGGAALHNTSKVTIEQAMGMASGMAAATLPVGEFSTMMIRLGNNFSQGKLDDKFEALGVSTKDSAGELRSFAEVLFDVQKQWNTLDDTAKSSFLTGAGGVYADRLALYMGVGDDYQKGTQIAQQDNSGSAEAEFNRVTDTFDFAMSKFKVTISDFATAFWGTLLPPLTKFIKIVDTIVSKISGFMQAHPIVMKVASSFILLAGVAMTLGGMFLLLNGFIAKVVQTMVTGNGVTVLFTNLFKGLGLVYKGLGTQILKLIPRFLSLSGAIGAVYLAWKYDLFGIRSLFDEFSSKVKNAMAQTHDLLSDGMSVKTFNANIQKLNDSNSVFDKLVLGATKVGMALKGLGEYISQGSLSDDMFQKLNALGLMPFISVVIGLGMRFKALWDGIKEGFGSAIDWINSKVRTVLGPAFTWVHDNVLLPVAKALFGVDENVTDLGDSIDGIQFVDLDAMFGPIENWEAIGKAIGAIAAGFVALKTVATIVGVIGKVGGVIGTVVSVIGKVGSAIVNVIRFVPTIIGWITSIPSAISTVAGAIGSFISGIGGVATTILGAIGTVVTAILGFFGIVVTLPAWVVGLITVAVVAVIGLVIHFRDEIWNFLTVTLPNAIGIAVDWVVNFFTVTIPNALQTAGEWLYNLFTNTIPSAIGYGIGWIAGNVYMFFTETLPGWIDTAVTAIGTFFTETLPEYIGNAIDAIRVFFTETLPEVVGNAIDAIGEFFTVTLPNAIQTGFDAVVQFITVDVPEFFAELPDMLMELGQNIVDGFLNGLNAAWTAVTDAIGNFVSGFVDGFKDALGIHSPSTVMADIGGNVIEGLIVGIENFVGGVGDAIGNVVSTISDGIGGAVDSAMEWGSNLVDNIGSGIESAGSWIGEKATGIGSWISENWHSATNAATEWGSKVVDDIGSGISSATSFISETASTIGSTIKNSWNTLMDDPVQWGTNVVNNIGSGITKARNVIQTGMSAVGNVAKGAWDTVKANAPSWGVDLMNNVERGISSARGVVQSTVTSVTTNIQTTITDLANKAQGIASDMMSKYKSGIDSGKSPVASAVSAIGSTVSSGFNSIKSSALSWGSNLVDGFASGIRNAASKAASAASSVVNSVKNYMGFHSPSKMGEGRHIVEWGYNMVSGFAGGINDAQGLLENTVANVITNPMQDVLNNNASLPISAQSNVTTNETLNVSDTLGTYLNQIITLLTTIAEVNGGIIRSDIDTPNGVISSQNIDATKQTVSETEKLVAETRANNGQLVVNIESGAIQNSYRIDGKDVDEQKVMALINLVMDEQLLPLLLDKIGELKIALNE